MAKFVVDTNVLLAADTGDPPRHATHLSLACRERSLEWLEGFLDRGDRLVADGSWGILGEYERYRHSHRYLDLFLRQVFSASLIDFVDIEYDGHSHALLPESLATVVHDLADRKFVAVALADVDHPPIVNSADTDWLDWEEPLAASSISCLHLCAEELVQRAGLKAVRRVPLQ